MLDVTVKTLDGKNRSFAVDDNISVRQFKEHIASAIEIEPDVQRLIFQGRVLVDDKKIDEYNVNGKTVHVVQKPPPSSQRPGNTSSAEGGGATRERNEQRSRRDANNFVLGSFSMPSSDSPHQINNLVHQMLSGIGEMSRGGQMTSHSSVDGSSLDVHINMGRNGPQQNGPQSSFHQALQMLSSATDTLNRLENTSLLHESSHAESSGRGGTEDQSDQTGTSGEASSASTSQPRNPSVGDLSSLLDQMLQVQNRLCPHLLRYRQLLNDDPDFTNKRDDLVSAQRLSDLASEAMHTLSHSYHHISDLMVDWSRQPPRNLRAPPSVTPAAAVIQQTIPVQISLAHVPMPGMPGQAHTEMPAVPLAQPSSDALQAENRMESEPHASSQPRDSRPQFRMASALGGQSLSGLPHGFHVLMEMTPGAVSTTTGDLNFDVQTSNNSASTNTHQSFVSGTVPPGANTSTTSVGGGGMFPPADFLQNIVQMATNAALQGQSGRQVFMFPPQASGPMHTMSSQSSLSNLSAPVFPVPFVASSASVVPLPFTFGSPMTPMFSAVPNSSPCPHVGVQQATNISFPAASAGHHDAAPSHGRNETTQRQMPAAPGVDGAPPAVPVAPQFPVRSADLMSVDPYLPCHSRHFLSRRVSASAPGQNDDARHQNAEQTLNGIMSTMVSSIVRPLAEMGSNVTSSPNSGVANHVASLMSLLASSNSTGSFAPTSSSPSSNSTQPSDSPAAHDMFANIIQGISGELQHAFQGQTSRSISDFLAQLGSEYTLPQGEGFLTDLFRVVASHLAFSDLLMIFFGQPGPLQLLHGPLRQFVLQNLLNGDDNIDSAVDRLVHEMQPDIRTMTAGVEANENIDFAETLQQFIRVQLGIFIRLIMNASADTGFAANLYERCRNFVHEFIVLSQFCISGGPEALRALILQRLHIISSEMNPSMQSTMSMMAVQQLQQITPNIRLNHADIMQYVARHGGGNNESISLSSENSFESACDDTLQEVNISAEVSADAQMLQPRISESLLACLPTPPNCNSDADIGVTFGSEDWHAAVPTDWIPVIARDVVRQRRQAPQPSLSDAYLSGMPSKRRKVMNRERQRAALADYRIVLPDAVQRAAQQAGVIPSTSLSDLSEQVGSSPRLRTAFQQEIDSTIRERLAADPGYVPEKYPNAEKFFKSSN